MSGAVAQPALPPVAPPPQVAQAQAPAPNTLEKMAAEAGIRTCTDTVRRFGPALTGPEGSHSALLLPHPAAPDAAAFGASIERAEPNGVRFVGATFAPTVRGGCDLSYDMVDVWRKSCQYVAIQQLNYAKTLNVIGRSVFVVPFGPRHHVYLIRTAGGCVSITRELLFP